MKFLVTTFLMLFAAQHIANAQPQSVQVRESELELPTYLLNDPEKAPIFERDWSYQRARRSVYPYLLDDNMTRNRETRSYKALYLENEYVELCILPEIGGRLFYAIDKTNGYDIFYHQDVVKPANVGMVGSWISGGVEWNVFHHHRASSNMPVDYVVEEHEDGAKTIWVGETELRHRMQWAIGVTLRPGKSYMEISGRLINATQDDNSMLYWSNVSTGVDDTYQIIFPESTDFATFHCKNWFAHWPITHEPFNDMDFYKDNIDASWWKNHFMSNSMFAHDLKGDFIAGYDHGQKAGTMIVGNSHINKGGKFWLWGPNSMWDTKILTENAGHYIELMMGAYSDNQPDYNWSSPYETKQFTQYYYGVRDIEGVKVGNELAAMNFVPKGKGKYFLGVNTTSAMEDMTVTVTSDQGVLYSSKLSIAPDAPFVNTLSLDKNLKPHQMTVELKNNLDKVILSYTPRSDTSYDKPLPEVVERPLRPQDIENNEECFLVGLRNMQFHNPFVDPADYFKEVLRRDVNDTRSNTLMGVLARKNGEIEQAKTYLRRAIARQTKDYTRPRDCEALYNLGLILKSEGHYNDAMDTLYRATWNYTYNSAANYQLAQMYCSVGDYDKAIERLDEAIIHNGTNYNALNLKATILRKLSKNDEAEELLDRVLASVPLNIYATYEKDKVNASQEHKSLMRDKMESYVELALLYLHNGFAADAKEVLISADELQQYPTVEMWLAYLAHLQGDTAAAKQLFESALALPVTYCNPFRLETIAVLETAKEYCPQSEKPYYYLGCLLYNKQQDNAEKEWRKCVELNPNMDLAWRNIGWYNWLYTKNYDEAAKCYKEAVRLAPDEALYLEEQDQVLEFQGADVADRYEVLKRLHNTGVKRYYPLSQEVVTGIFMKDYDYVLGLLESCYFPTREGVANFHDVYVDALLMAGYDKCEKGAIKEAIALYNKAFEYPENHQVFLVDERTPRDAQIYMFIADAYERLGSKSKAKQYYKKATEVNVKTTDSRYWKGLAYSKLGNKAEATAIFEELVAAGEDAVVEYVVSFFGAEGTSGTTVERENTKAYYTQALGQLGLGNKDAAKALFDKSLSLKNDNLWAKHMSETIK